MNSSSSKFTAAVKTCPTCTYHELMQFQVYCCSKDMPNMHISWTHAVPSLLLQ